MQTNVESLFVVLEETASILQEKLDITFLEATAETGENLFCYEIVQKIDDITKRRLQNEYNKVKHVNLSKEDVRKAFQLCMLKGMKEGTQSNHEMTPDAVAMFVGYLTSKLMEKKKSFRLLDPAIGTGNLVTAVLNQVNKPVQTYGIDVDEVLVKLSYVNANAQQHEVELFRQDSLQRTMIDPVDVIVCDLPVGYYPNDEAAKDYQLAAGQGHSFSHYLFIEKSMNQVIEGGFLLLLIPNFLFEGEEAKRLNKYIKEHANILGLLQLPLSMFKQKQFSKSIFLLQKKGGGIKPPNQALLAELPSFSNQQALQQMMSKIDKWFEAEI